MRALYGGRFIKPVGCLKKIHQQTNTFHAPLPTHPPSSPPLPPQLKVDSVNFLSKSQTASHKDVQGNKSKAITQPLASKHHEPHSTVYMPAVLSRRLQNPRLYLWSKHKPQFLDWCRPHWGQANQKGFEIIAAGSLRSWRHGRPPGAADSV